MKFKSHLAVLTITLSIILMVKLSLNAKAHMASTMEDTILSSYLHVRIYNVNEMMFHFKRGTQTLKIRCWACIITFNKHDVKVENLRCKHVTTIVSDRNIRMIAYKPQNITLTVLSNSCIVRVRIYELLFDKYIKVYREYDRIYHAACNIPAFKGNLTLVVGFDTATPLIILDLKLNGKSLNMNAKLTEFTLRTFTIIEGLSEVGGTLTVRLEPIDPKYTIAIPPAYYLDELLYRRGHDIVLKANAESNIIKVEEPIIVRFKLFLKPSTLKITLNPNIPTITYYLNSHIKCKVVEAIAYTKKISLIADSEGLLDYEAYIIKIKPCMRTLSLTGTLVVKYPYRTGLIRVGALKDVYASPDIVVVQNVLDVVWTQASMQNLMVSVEKIHLNDNSSLRVNVEELAYMSIHPLKSKVKGETISYTPFDVLNITIFYVTSGGVILSSSKHLVFSIPPNISVLHLDSGIIEVNMSITDAKLRELRNISIEIPELCWASTISNSPIRIVLPRGEYTLIVRWRGVEVYRGIILIHSPGILPTIRCEVYPIKVKVLAKIASDYGGIRLKPFKINYTLKITCLDYENIYYTLTANNSTKEILLVPGDYDISLYVSGVEVYHERLRLDKDELNSGVMEVMVESYRLKIYVEDLLGTPVKDLKVQVLNSRGKPLLGGATSRYGYIEFEGLPRGDYIVKLHGKTFRIHLDSDKVLRVKLRAIYIARCIIDVKWMLPSLIVAVIILVSAIASKVRRKVNGKSEIIFLE